MSIIIGLAKIAVVIVGVLVIAGFILGVMNPKQPPKPVL